MAETVRAPVAVSPDSEPRCGDPKDAIGALVIREERPDQPEVLRLLAARDGLSAVLYPPRSNDDRDVEALLRPGVTFLVARRDGIAVGCGALARGGDRAGEVKSMFVDTAARGTGAGRKLLERLELDARGSGLTVVRLETGIDSAAARRLYERAGYRYVGPCGGGPGSAWSVFMEKRLAPAEAA